MILSSDWLNSHLGEDPLILLTGLALITHSLLELCAGPGSSWLTSWLTSLVTSTMTSANKSSAKASPKSPTST